MTDSTLIVGPTGEITTEGMDPADLEGLLGKAQEVNCAKPLEIQKVDLGPHAAKYADLQELQVHSIYYGSVVDGPGVRNVLKVQGCPVRCPHCFVPDTHDMEKTAGVWMSVDKVADLLIREPCDGITFMGGEPMAQAEALCRLIWWLGGNKTENLVLYTGYTWKYITIRGTDWQRRLLRAAHMVIEGPYVAKLAEGVGEWRGSSNQNFYIKGVKQ